MRLRIYSNLAAILIKSGPTLLFCIIWLHGTIPEEFSSISTLENLVLDNNGLTGSIPAGLVNCTNLNWISLSSNQLSGEIPSWFGRMSKLAILQLKNNSFSGMIPPELGDCKSLIWLDLNSNNLTGPTPGALAKQSGSIATGLISDKRYVYLKNDDSSTCRGAGSLVEFSGIRQEQLQRVPTRHACNFTRSYMSDIHYTFSNNGSMIFLDLSYNSLSDPMPPEFGNMFYILVLNLGHNSLTGKIPDELGKLWRSSSSPTTSWRNQSHPPSPASAFSLPSTSPTTTSAVPSQRRTDLLLSGVRLREQFRPMRPPVPPPIFCPKQD